MLNRNRIRGILTLGLIIIFLVPTPNSEGLSNCMETGIAFKAGTMDNLSLNPDTLALNLAEPMQNNWTLISSGIPEPRYGHTMSYSSQTGETLLFGGYNEFIWLNDTWSYNLSQNRWTANNPILSPPARYGHAVIFEEIRNTLVLFGGADTDIVMNDTWTYDVNGNIWKNKSPPLSPPARYIYAMAYDASSDAIILFGGLSPESVELGDTWIYRLVDNTWTNLSPSVSPSGRFGHSMAYDSKNGEVVLFGGRSGYYELNDTWTYNLTSNLWTKKNTAIKPPGRDRHSFVYDNANSRMIMFGGINDSSRLTDTWTYDPGTGLWEDMNPPRRPPARLWQAMAYDRNEKKAVLFSGSFDSHSFPSNMDDTWTFDPSTNNWTEITISSPSGRAGHTMVIDSAHDSAVLFGGWSGNAFMESPRNDTWIYDLATQTWRDMNPSCAPPPSIDHPLAYATTIQECVLFRSSDNYRLNEIWTYNMSLNNWAFNYPSSSSPSNRDSYGLAYDSEQDNIILFGGAGSNSICLDETWTFEVPTSRWYRLDPAIAPTAREEPGIAYDGSRDEMVLFGGRNRTGVFNDTWIYNLTNNEWMQRSPPVSPPARTGFSMVYNEKIDEILLFGGWNGTQLFGDTWTYNLSVNNWTEITPIVSPPPRKYHSIIHDSKRGEETLFGGYGSLLKTDDTWTYNAIIYLPSGRYTSMPHDLGGSAYFGQLSWDADNPQKTSIQFQIRTANTNTALVEKPYIGPDDTANSFYQWSGQRIAPSNNGSRWFQYRVQLTTENLKISPKLRTLSIGYNLIQEVRLTSPAAGENWTGIQDIRWSASDPDNDTLTFDIFLEGQSSSTLIAGGLPESMQKFSWNTEMVQNGTYKIRVTARDDNDYIPLAVDALSGNFTIFHPPPPNHLPHIALQSPSNNSIINTTSVRLAWRGTDPDGDMLTYEVRYSAGPLEFSPAITNITTSEYLDISNLSDNTIYYWTVTADDGSGFRTDVPTDVWSFIVRLPAPNRPPRITSLPATSVTAGDLFQYNLTAIDEDFTILHYTLVTGPPDMSIDNATGKLRWQTTIADIGNHTITVRVSDTAGATDNQTFKLEVLAPPAPPQKPTCTITSPANNSKLSGRILVRGTAQNGTRPLTIVQVRLDGGPWRTAGGLGNWSMNIDLGNTPAGRHTIEARSFDGSLHSDPGSIQITVKNREPGTTLDETPWLGIALVVVILVAAGFYLVRRKLMS